MEGLVYPFDRYFLLNTSSDIFEKEANEFMQNENYLKLRRNLSSAVSGCFMLSFLTTL